MRKQLDHRWKQLDKFETSLKAVAEAKTAWRKKLSAKEGEVEALKTTISELQAQLVSIRKPGQGDSMEVRALAARANNAERRITNLQNQLLLSEEKLTTMNQKTVAADSKWEVRVKEYETRLKKAEEAVKRERQGAKERVFELETQLKSIWAVFIIGVMCADLKPTGRYSDSWTSKTNAISAFKRLPNRMVSIPSHPDHRSSGKVACLSSFPFQFPFLLLLMEHASSFLPPLSTMLSFVDTSTRRDRSSGLLIVHVFVVFMHIVSNNAFPSPRSFFVVFSTDFARGLRIRRLSSHRRRR